MPGKGIHGVAHDRLQPGGRTKAAEVHSPSLVPAPLGERHHFGDYPARVRPVDHRHAGDYADHHASRRHCEAERRAFLPPGRNEALLHSADGAVAALEADLDEIAEARRHAKPARKHEASEAEPDHVLPPRDYLAHHELRIREGDDAPDVRQRLAEEERRKDDVDQEARDLAHGVDDLARHPVPGDRQHGEADEAADDGAGQIQALQDRDPHPHDLAGHKEPAKRDEDYDCGRHRKITLLTALSAAGRPPLPNWLRAWCCSVSLACIIPNTVEEAQGAAERDERDGRDR